MPEKNKSTDYYVVAGFRFDQKKPVLSRDTSKRVPQVSANPSGHIEELAKILELAIRKQCDVITIRRVLE